MSEDRMLRRIFDPKKEEATIGKITLRFEEVLICAVHREEWAGRIKGVLEKSGIKKRTGFSCFRI
jgi:hypothetical protein